MKSRCLAPPARLELTTLRLGGARSIQVSYGGILIPLIVPKNLRDVNSFPDIFSFPEHILEGVFPEGVRNMWDHVKQPQDLDDLLFTEEDGGPSER